MLASPLRRAMQTAGRGFSDLVDRDEGGEGGGGEGGGGGGGAGGGGGEEGAAASSGGGRDDAEGGAERAVRCSEAGMSARRLLEELGAPPSSAGAAGGGRGGGGKGRTVPFMLLSGLTEVGTAICDVGRPVSELISDSLALDGPYWGTDAIDTDHWERNFCQIASTVRLGCVRGGGGC